MEDRNIAMHEKITQREYDVLRELSDEEWMTPRFVGGRDGSHHSQTLVRLAECGLALRKKLHSVGCSWGTARGGAKCQCRGSCKYRRTPKGKAAFKSYVEKA